MTEDPDFEAIAASSRHGSRSRYKAGCRCDECRGANAAYQRRRRNELRSEPVALDHNSVALDHNTGGWSVAAAGIAAGLAVVWAVVRKAASS